MLYQVIRLPLDTHLALPITDHNQLAGAYFVKTEWRKPTPTSIVETLHYIKVDPTVKIDVTLLDSSELLDPPKVDSPDPTDTDYVGDEPPAGYGV